MFFVRKTACEIRLDYGGYMKYLTSVFLKYEALTKNLSPYYLCV